MVERSQFPLAHELPRADLDHRDARGVVEVRNDSSAMALVRVRARRRTRAAAAP